MLAGLAVIAYLIHSAEKIYCEHQRKHSRDTFEGTFEYINVHQDYSSIPSVDSNVYKDAGYGTLTDSLPETSSLSSGSGDTLRVSLKSATTDSLDDRSADEQEEFEVTVDYSDSPPEPVVSAELKESQVLESIVPNVAAAPITEQYAAHIKPTSAEIEEFAAALRKLAVASSQATVAAIQKPVTTAPESVTTAPESVTTAPESVTTAPESVTTVPEPVISTLSHLEKLRRLAPVRLHCPSCPDSELGDLTAFPSLPNSRLESLGLLPGSLAELQAANSAVSIVDPNCRYRMEGPPEPESPPEAPLEDRVRELEISFANDAGTLDTRVKRISLTRASLESNLARELDQLEGRLTRLSEPELAADVRVLRDTTARLSSTAEVVGAVEQECRLNFAFHLVHKYSDNLRAEKERMSAELELLRQAVEDENFYLDRGQAIAGFKGRGKFQKVGQDVARASSVTSMMQRMARERQRRKIQADGASQDDAADGALINDPSIEDALGLDNEGISSGEPVDPDGSPAGEKPEQEQTVLDKLDQMSTKMYADRRVRLFIVPTALLIAVVFLLWAIAYPIVKRFSA